MSKIKLGKKSYTLKYDINAFCALEEHTKYQNMNDLQTRSAAGEISAMRALVWAGMLHENPDITQEQVGLLIGDFKNMTTIMEGVAIAVAESMPDPDEGEDDVEGDPTK